MGCGMPLGMAWWLLLLLLVLLVVAAPCDEGAVDAVVVADVAVWLLRTLEVSVVPSSSLFCSNQEK